MRKIVYLPILRRDQRRILKRGKEVEKLLQTVFLLATQGALPARYRPHKLHGVYSGYWECHMEADWLLIYALTRDEVIIVCTGTHDDLFEN